MFIQFYFPLFLLPLAFAYTNTGLQIRDLWETASSDVSSWAFTSVIGSTTISCGSRIVAGYGQSSSGTGSRTYTGLDTHTGIILVMSIWFFDSTDGNDYIGVNVDGTNFNYVAPNSPPGADYCSRGHSDMGEYRIIIYMSHSSSSLSLTVFNGHNQGPYDEEYGFSSVTITLTNQTFPTTTYYAGQGPNFQSYTRITNFGGLLSSSSCTGNCALCTTSSATNCLACPTYGYFYSASTSSCSACDVACKVCSASDNCRTNLCDAGYFYYTNSSCQASCTYPFTSQANTLGSDKCNFICGTDYVWPNGTCSSSCPSPFVARTSYTYKYCDDNPCKDTTLSTRTYYNSWTGYCIGCSFPALLLDNQCVCPVGSVMNSSKVCVSTSFLELKYNYTSESNHINITANISYDEFVAYPSQNYIWLASSSNPSSNLLASLQFFLNSISGLNVSISYEYFEPNVTYNITCYYNNSIGMIIANETFFGPLDWLLPEITNSQVTETIFRGFSRQFSLPFSQKIFGPPLNMFNFDWTVTKGNITSYTGTNSSILIPACSSGKNETFQLKLNASYKINPLFYTESYINFSTHADNFTISLSKFNVSQPFNLPIIVDINANYGANCSDMDFTGASFIWKCLKIYKNQSIANCTDPFQLFNNLTTSHSLQVPRSYYMTSEKILLEATMFRDVMNATASGNFSIVGTNVLVVDVTCTSSLCTKYSSNQDLKLLATAQDNPGIDFNYAWNISVPASIINFKNSFYLNADFTGLGNVTLRIGASIVDPNYSGLGYYNIPVNSPPSSGALSANPTTGNSLSTKFSIVVSNWTDEDLPLSYTFFYKNQNDFITIAQKQQITLVSTFLSGAIPSEEIPFYCDIYDSLGAYTRANVNVTVLSPDLPIADAINNILSVDFLNETDPYKKTVQSTIVISQLSNVENSWAELRKNITNCTGCANNEKICVLGNCSCLNASLALVDCTLSSEDYSKVVGFKNSIVDSLKTTLVGLQSDNSSNSSLSSTKDSALSNLKIMSSKPEFVSQNVINKIQDLLETTLQVKNPSVLLTPSQAVQTTKILDNFVGFTSSSDCSCSTTQCKSLQNTTLDYLNKVTASSLENKIPGQSPISISTEAFDLVATRTTACLLPTLTLQMPNGGPQVSFLSGDGISLNCSEALDVQAYAFKGDLFLCDKEDSSKDTIMLGIKDILTGVSKKSLFSVRLEGAKCPITCDKVGLYCDCNINLFDIGDQLGKIFGASALKDLGNLSAFQNWKFYESPIFWVNFAAFWWFIANTLLFSKSQKLKKYCLTDNVEKRNHISRLECFGYMYMSKNEMLEFYIINEKPMSKMVRGALYYLKIVLFSTYSAIFSGVKSGDNLLDMILSLQIYLVLLPYVTVIPIHKIWTFLIVKIFKKTVKVTKLVKLLRRGVIVLSIIIWLGCLFAMFIIAASKSTDAQLPWLATFIATFLQDVFLNPFLIIGFQLSLIKLRERVSGKKHGILKKIMLNQVDPNCALFYVKFIFLLIFKSKAVSGGKIFKIRHMDSFANGKSFAESRLSVGKSQNEFDDNSRFPLSEKRLMKVQVKSKIEDELQLENV